MRVYTVFHNMMVEDRFQNDAELDEFNGSAFDTISSDVIANDIRSPIWGSFTRDAHFICALSGTLAEIF